MTALFKLFGLMLVLRAECFSTKREPSLLNASDSLFHCGKNIYTMYHLNTTEVCTSVAL